MFGNSKPVSSQQTGVAEKLEALVRKHLQHDFRKPYHSFSSALFEKIDRLARQQACPVILDAGCGTGASSRELARRYPDRVIVGIDKSHHRLKQYLQEEELYCKNNLILARAELVDFWRLLAESDWEIEKQYILYPNPWPKPEQLKRRWYAHPVFPTLLKAGMALELRTNWKVYADEFRQALTFASRRAKVETFETNSFISPFERKFTESKHTLYKVTSDTYS